MSRDDERAQARALIGEVRGKHALVVDDEIATGWTVFAPTDFPASMRREISLSGCGAPVLSGGAYERLAQSFVI